MNQIIRIVSVVLITHVCFVTIGLVVQSGGSYFGWRSFYNSYQGFWGMTYFDWWPMMIVSVILVLLCSKLFSAKTNRRILSWFVGITVVLALLTYV